MIPPFFLIKMIKDNQHPITLTEREAKVMVIILLLAAGLIIYMGINMHLHYKDQKERSEAQRIQRNVEFQAYLERSQNYQKCLQDRIQKREQNLPVDESVECVPPRR